MAACSTCGSAKGGSPCLRCGDPATSSSPEVSYLGSAEERPAVPGFGTARRAARGWSVRPHRRTLLALLAGLLACSTLGVTLTRHSSGVGHAADVNQPAEAVAARYCGMNDPDLTLLGAVPNSSALENELPPGAGPNQVLFTYSGPAGTLVLTRTQDGEPVVQCPSGMDGNH